MKKIMFNDKCGLTEAVLEGRKTMTRRIMPECRELDTHPMSRAKEKFGTAYNMAFHNLFAKSYEDYLGYVQPILPEATVDAKAFLEDYFNIDLTI